MLLIKYSGTQKHLFGNTGVLCWRALIPRDTHCRQWAPDRNASWRKPQHWSLSSVSAWLFVQAHGWTLVHAHVCIAKKSARTALNPSGVQRVQVLQRHLQVLSYFWAGCHLWNVEAILTTISISHAVKEEPGRVILPVLHKSNIVARFYAENSKQLHLLTWDAAMSPVPVGQVFGKWYWMVSVIQPSGMKVNLSAAGLTELLDLPCWDVRVVIALSTLIHGESSTDAALPGSVFK